LRGDAVVLLLPTTVANSRRDNSLMAKKPKPLVAGNWKMNGLLSSRRELARLARKLARSKQKPRCEVIVCPPATLVALARVEARGSRLAIGAQDCHQAPSGAHTGDISAEMLVDAGAAAIIVGHSERRADHGERNADVAAKAAAAHRAGAVAIVCVGETGAEREARRTLSVVSAQIKGSLPDGTTAANTVIAYEPVWAIGTGLTPTPRDIAAVHAHIRKRLTALLGAEHAERMRILYGGSVKPDNAGEILAVDNVDGALVGGASLKAEDFLAIVGTYRK
jgi:triosephosphate isomerase